MGRMIDVGMNAAVYWRLYTRLWRTTKPEMRTLVRNARRSSEMEHASHFYFVYELWHSRSKLLWLLCNDFGFSDMTRRECIIYL